MEPSGSKDPFALRRAGGIVVKLIRAFGISFPMQKVIKANVDLYGNKVKLDEMRLGLFIRDRIIFELGVKPGTRAGEILASVIASNADDLADVFKRFDALNGMDEKILIKAAKVIQRTANMLKGYGKTPGEPKEELLTEAEEKKLFELFRAQAKNVTEPLEKGEYEKATRVFAELFAATLNDFFDHVLVNAEDAALRENRMALVAKVNRLYTAKIADLSALSRIDEE
jgi:glycyl-tRNA synthetase beta chain